MSKALPYYDFGPVLSRNAAYNFIIGARGLGKTYGAKKRVIRDYLKNGNQFIYLRRYKPELKSRMTFFSDLVDEFPGITFRVAGDEAQVCRKPNAKKPKWETIGYFIALSVAQTKKSVAFPRVTTIIYDEFIIEKGSLHYLPNEAKSFNDFYSTVDRWKDKTKVLFLANAVSIANPYFLEYNIEPKPNTEWMTKYKGFLCIHFADSAEFATEVFNTRFGQFIQGTEYADYSVSNVFGDNHDAMIATKPPEAKYLYTLDTGKGVFSVWQSEDFRYYWLQAKRPREEFYCTTVHDKMNNDRYLLDYSHKWLQNLRGKYSAGRLYFDKPATRNAYTEIYRR